MNNLVHHVAIVSETNQINFDDVSVVVAAVAKQVARDFGPAWGIQATVDAFYSLSTVPSDYWRVLLMQKGQYPGAAGYHADADGQPLAVVELEGDWPVTVSHEVLEMLADPFANRIIAGDYPIQASGVRDVIPEFERADFLVEVCDPVGGQATYAVNGVPVSNFVLPAFYGKGDYTRQVDHLGSLCGMPRTVDDAGGYITFRNPATNTWYQLVVENGIPTGHEVSMGNLPHVGSACLREGLDAFERAKRGSKIHGDRYRARAQSHGGHASAARIRAHLEYLAGTIR